MLGTVIKMPLERDDMFDIGFGLLFYKLMLWSLWFFVPMIFGPFVVNLFGGKGYFHYAGRAWRFFFHVLSLGLLKHKPATEQGN